METGLNAVNIVHVITGLDAGGAETVVYRLLSRHDHRRFHPTVISLMPCRGLPLERKIAALGVEVYSLGLRPGRPHPGALLALLKKLRALRPDLVCGWEVHGNVAVAGASFFHARTPTVWNVCNSLGDLSTEKPATRALIWALARVSHRPRRIIYNSPVSVRQHEAIGYRASRSVYIPNGFDCDVFRPDSEARAAVRRELGLEPEVPLVGLIARYHPVKDHATFLEGARRVAALHPHAHFLLAGRGVAASNPALLALLDDLGLASRVSLLGERQDIPRLMAALDVACLTSLAESSPVVIGEAMACGVPCVATDVGDVAAVVGEHGRIVPRRNPQAFAGALDELLRMPAEHRRDLGARARRQVLDRHHLDKIAAAFDDVHLGVLAEVGRSPASTKVLHILGDSKWGGGSAGTLAMAETAQRAGWAVDLLTTDPLTIAAARQRGLGVVDLDVIWRDIRPWRDLRGLWRLRGFLKSAGYDLVHTHTSKAGFVGRIAATLVRAPVVVHTMHGFAIHEGSPAAVRHAYALLEKIAAYCCHRLVTVSHFHRRWALELGIASERKLVAIPNGVPEHAPAAGRAETRRSLALADYHVAVLSNSRVAAEKGLEDLMDAAALLPDEAADRIRILVAGEGPLRPALEQMARRLGVDRLVRFLGHRSDMPDVLAAADIVALPSLREGLSMALLEAMAAGKPVVATSIGSIKEATRHGESALLVPARNPAALAAALAELTAHPDRAARLGRRGREIYEQEYNVARMTSQYLHLYQELLGDGLPGGGVLEGTRYSHQA